MARVRLSRNSPQRNLLTRVASLTSRAVLSGVLVLLMATSALAQDAPATKEAWVLSYALVILLVGLGLFVICRPARHGKKVDKS